MQSPAVERIESADDPRLSDYVGMSERDLMLARGLFVAEGRLLLRRVIERGDLSVRSVLLSESARAALAGELVRLPAATPVYTGSRDLFQHVTGYNIHRGALALVERPRAAAIDDVLAGARLIVVLDGVADADNVGGVFRNAAAFGADAVLLSPSTCDPLYRKALRTSMGATLAVPFARINEWPAGIADLKARSFKVAELTPREPAEALDVFAGRPRPERLALLIGTEGAGVSAGAMALVDGRVRIPMQPGVDSLNLAVAAGIALSRLSDVGRR